MADFETAFENLLKIEGGYSPTDNTQGAVNRGITQNLCDLVRLSHPDLPPNVRDWTLPQTRDTYKEFYWDHYRLGEISSQRVAELLFSCLVNTDPQVVVTFLHFALEDAGSPVAPRSILPSQRVIGTKTIHALNSLPPTQTLFVIDAVKAAMLTRYTRLATQNPGMYGDDLPGWKRRLERL